MIKQLLLAASTNKRLERIGSTNRLTRNLVSRFVAGTTLEEAIEVTKELNAPRGSTSVWTCWGRRSKTCRSPTVATEAYIEAVQAIAAQCPGTTVSVKLSQLGIGLDPAVCAGHLKNLLEAADKVGVLVEIDMEHSSVGPASWRRSARSCTQYPDTRVAMQAAMRRTPTTWRRSPRSSRGSGWSRARSWRPRTRRCRTTDEVTAQYLYLTDWALENLPDPAFGTHDDRVHRPGQAVRRTGFGVDRSDFEFQMLYGVRRDVQQQAGRGGLPDPHLRALRHPVVPVPDAADGRAAGQPPLLPPRP